MSTYFDRSSTEAGIFTWVERGRIPCLDGFRGVSILLVILCHCGYAYHSRLSQPLQRLLGRSAIGVDVFFVISGLLITLLLLREQTANGQTWLLIFYLRRAYRILPAYLCFAAAIPVFERMRHGITPLSWRAWLSVPTFFVDFLMQRPLGINHLWSLSVEEHFYLVFPALLWWNRRWAARLTLALVVITPVLRFFSLHTPFQVPDVKFWTVTRSDSIAVGCLLAFALASRRLRPWLTWTAGQAASATTAAAAILLLTTFLPLNRVAILYANLFGSTVDAVCIAVIIWSTISHSRSFAGRLLETRPMVLIGLVSYSIYLWQQPLTTDAATGPLVIRLLLLAILATASYLLIEQPFLRLKIVKSTRQLRLPNHTHPDAKKKTSEPGSDDSTLGTSLSCLDGHEPHH